MALQNIIKWLRWPVWLLSIAFVVYKLWHMPAEQWQLLWAALAERNPWWPLLALLLMPLNWLCEAWRWYLINQSSSTIATFAQSLRGVVAGLALSWGAPMGTGDFMGRVRFAHQHKKRWVAGNLLVSRLAMACITLAFGLLAFWGWWHHQVVLGWRLGAVAFAALLLLWAGVRLVAAWLPQHSQYKLLNLFWSALQPVGQYSMGVWWGVLFITALRYCVFVAQFVVLLHWAGAHSSVPLLAQGVGFIVFAKTYLPAFSGLADLGLREFTGLVFFDRFEAILPAVVMAGFCIWVVNVLLPSLVGFWVGLRKG